MGSNQIRRTGADPAAKADGRSSGQTIDPGPYEAIVVKQVEGTRSGQLLVYIPDFGGNKTDPNDQILVSYASPFFGTTVGTDEQNSNPNAPNAQWTTGMSYGFWFVPPDVNNKVLVTFAAGDRSRGYWFACIYDSTTHHMVPAIGRNVGGFEKTAAPKPGDQLNKALIARKSDGAPVSPVVEGYSGTPESQTPDRVTATPRYAHEYQNLVLVGQGLDGDPVRGAISSSSLREAPSNCYGISTPGPKVGSKSQQKEVDGADGGQAVFARKGGHTFVMDDGDSKGVDQLMRLRTSGGHQILMNDTVDVLYIASKSGKQWLEFSNDGSINIYAKTGFNVRTDGELNLHGEKSVNIHSNGKVRIYGETGIDAWTHGTFSAQADEKAQVLTDGQLDLSSGTDGKISVKSKLKLCAGGEVEFDGASVSMNSSGTIDPTPPNVSAGSKATTTFDGTIWVNQDGTLTTICTRVPSHEPWYTGDVRLAKRPL